MGGKFQGGGGADTGVEAKSVGKAGTTDTSADRSAQQWKDMPTVSKTDAAANEKASPFLNTDTSDLYTKDGGKAKPEDSVVTKTEGGGKAKPEDGGKAKSKPDDYGEKPKSDGGQAKPDVEKAKSKPDDYGEKPLNKPNTNPPDESKEKADSKPTLREQKAAENKSKLAESGESGSKNEADGKLGPNEGSGPKDGPSTAPEKGDKTSQAKEVDPGEDKRELTKNGKAELGKSLADALSDPKTDAQALLDKLGQNIRTDIPSGLPSSLNTALADKGMYPSYRFSADSDGNLKLHHFQGGGREKVVAQTKLRPLD